MKALHRSPRGPGEDAAHRTDLTPGAAASGLRPFHHQSRPLFDFVEEAMLALLGFATIGVFLAAIMTKRVSVLVALILIPLIFALIGGFGLGLGKMMLDGIVRV